MGHRPDIDGLRALAIIPVVFYHAATPGFTGGFVGVDVFFVISGYLITQMIAKDLAGGRFSIADFYARRVRRIVPALTAMLIAVTAFTIAIFTPQEMQRYGLTLISAALFVANVFFWRTENYFAAEPEPNPLLHTWSLAVEEQFYIIWPLLLMAIFALGLRRYLKPLMLIALPVAFVVAIIAVRSNPQFAFYMLPTRAWELMLGATLALGAVPALRNRLMREAACAIGVLVILASVVLLNNRTEIPGPWLLMPCLGAAMVLHAGASGVSFAGRMLALPPLVGAGLISYSLYLWHWPLLVLPQLTLARPLEGVEAGVAILLSILISAVSWRFVEQPFRSQSLSESGMIRRFLTGGALALGTLALAGFAVMNAGAALWRNMPSAITADASVIHDLTPVCLMRERTSGEASELPPLEPCLFGADPKGPPRTVLWGDSHSNHLRGALEDWAKANAITARQISKALCPPLLGATPALPPRNMRADCVRFNQETMEWIAATPSVKQVILAARWPVYLGRAFPRPGINPILTTGERVPDDDRGALDAFKSALDKTLQSLTAHKLAVVVVAPLPDFFQGGSKCVGRARAMGWDEARCNADIAEIAKRMGPVREAIRVTAAKYQGVTVIDPVPLFCGTTVCKPTREGQVVFRDDNHVTPIGAKLIVAEFPVP